MRPLLARLATTNAVILSASEGSLTISAADARSQLLRLHRHEQASHHSLPWGDERSRTPNHRAQERRNSRIHSALSTEPPCLVRELPRCECSDRPREETQRLAPFEKE